MRILVATDAWTPQVNGVVRSLEETARALAGLGHETAFLIPGDFRTVPLPLYPEIRVALAGVEAAGRAADRFQPDAIHVATEGPIGLAMRRHCLRGGLAFTTSYHTRFPEYVRARLPVPLAWSYAWLRRFHGAAAATFVATKRLRRDLARRGFRRLRLWSRGVDTDLFRSDRDGRAWLGLSGPVFLSVGRLAVEKNLDAFLSLDLPGRKVVVGDGPDGPRLRARYPDAVFLGTRTGPDLAAIYAAADVFVFPSLTDTFGNVMLEALACGTPVAAFPVAGPADVVGGSDAAVLDSDLRQAALAALAIPRGRCRSFATRFSWEASAAQFLDALVPVCGTAARPAGRRFATIAGSGGANRGQART